MLSKTDKTAESVAEQVRGARNALTVRRVFGKAYEVDGITIIPVARVAGGAGGGGGEGTKQGEDGSGFGTGFGLRAQPVGVYEIRDGNVLWKPVVDVNRVVAGGQIVASIVAVCVSLVLIRRSR